MTVCKHCGTEIEDGLEYCPNCGQSIEDSLGDFFEPVEELEEEAYNIFDAPDEFDMEGLLEKELGQGMQKESSNQLFGSGADVSREEPEDFMNAFFEETAAFSETESAAETEEFPEFGSQEEIPAFDGADLFAAEDIPELQPAQPEEQGELSELFGMFGDTTEEVEELSVQSAGGIEFPTAGEEDFLALDDLFQDLDGSEEVTMEETNNTDHGLEELLAVASEEAEPKESKKQKEKKQKKESQSFFQTVFGNVPVDPSKMKAEPTPEQKAAKKQKKAEEKKAKAEEKKLSKQEKKQNAQREKAEKARQKSLAREEKKAKKMLEAKMILEEMKETRINRVGATVVFMFFAVCAIVLFSGSDIFGYAISINHAEKNFNKAYNNNVKYYTDAYNEIYGLDIKEEDQRLNDQIMTVMFVNKELNSYNSQMRLGDFEAALHSLLLGLYRYGAYFETGEAMLLGIDKDLDFVRTQILKELKKTFNVSEDEAELLRSMLAKTGVGGMNASIDADAAREYNLKLYEIVLESGLKDDSNN